MREKAIDQRNTGNMYLLYTYEKLSDVERELTLGPGDMRSRLLSAFRYLDRLCEEDFPGELKEDYRWVIKKLTVQEPWRNYKGEIKVDAVEMTLGKMQNKTGVKIAQKLLKMKGELRREHL